MNHSNFNIELQMPPPRLRSLSALPRSLARPATEISPCLLPFLYTQQRTASILSSLADNPSALRNRTRLGRGPSSGKGKTSGRGHKGQKQHGKVPRGFNGGQTPDIVVSGKRGDHNFARSVTLLLSVAKADTVFM
jgi:large subunit ribosomal protein L15